MVKVVIEIKSENDLQLSERIIEALDKLGIESVLNAFSSTLHHEIIEEGDYVDMYSKLIDIQNRIKEYRSYDDIKEGASIDMYSNLIDIQRRTKQYLYMTSETRELDYDRL